MSRFRVLFVAPLGLLIALASIAAPAAQSDEADRLREAGVVFEEIMAAPDSAIPTSVLDNADGLAIFPSTLKAGFIVGAHRGRGVLSVRDRRADAWSSPAFLTLTGGSIGVQIGGQSVDIVLVVMNRRGLENLVSNQFKIGADAAVAAGPVGRDAAASTDIQLRAQILSYSRARGLFAGVTLNGTSIRQDRDANETFYGHPYRTREIVFDGKGVASAPVRAFTNLLKQHAG